MQIKHFKSVITQAQMSVVVAIMANALDATAQTPSDTTTYTLTEVVVTAQESRRPTSASVIDSMAMKHLQPSSFTDLLELLPGNITVDPNMGSVNSIALRQASGAGVSDDYATSALGTLFVVDGMPINTNAEMVTTPDANQTGRISVGRGVDMRKLSTDDIDQVEIIRGIPSVEYGELTSGMVKVKRKSGASRLETRFKADNQGWLVYAGKGTAIGASGFILNTSVSWFDSKIDPRNNRENFRRVGASLRSDYALDNEIVALSWNSAIDYTGTFETDNNDPDLTINGTIDDFSRRDHGISWSNSLTIRPTKSMFFREGSLSAGISASWEHLHQHKHVASSRIMPLPVSTTAGSNYVDYLPLLYLSDYDVYGIPVTSYAKAISRFRQSTDDFIFALNGGGEWNFSKNYGGGEVYDLMRPLTAGNNTRPRAFSAVPAMNQISAFAETEAKWFPRNFTLGLNVGARLTALVGMNHKYTLNGKPYIDPRANLFIVFPGAYLWGYPMRFEIAGGIGQHTKMPVAAYLYPNLLYSDFEQLNYYHDDAAYRTMNVKTFVEDLTNYNLKAARNLKQEIRADLSYRGNRLSVSLFRETMKDGFRHAGTVHRYTYTRYDASSYDPTVTGHAPTIEELPGTTTFYQTVRNKVTNGSRTDKEGVEFTFQSCRVPAIRTRLTVSGAWLRTDNSNSDALWYKPSIVIGGNELQYIGLYDDRDGSRYESFNTNFLFDTDIPRLKLNFSIGVQNMWYTSHQTFRKYGVPTHYVDTQGSICPFTAADMADPYLSHLVRTYSSGAFDRITVHVATTVNLKATKTFWKDRIGIAIYVNRLFSIMPDYDRYGVTVRRYTSPYFGMEINLRI